MPSQNPGVFTALYKDTYYGTGSTLLLVLVGTAWDYLYDSMGDLIKYNSHCTQVEEYLARPITRNIK